MDCRSVRFQLPAEFPPPSEIILRPAPADVRKEALFERAEAGSVYPEKMISEERRVSGNRKNACRYQTIKFKSRTKVGSTRAARRRPRPLPVAHDGGCRTA